MQYRKAVSHGLTASGEWPAQRTESRQFTTEEVAAVASGQWRDAEFVDLDGLRERFGLKRSLAYKLLNEGVIKGVSLRRRGSVRGKRLFVVESVREFLRGCADD